MGHCAPGVSLWTLPVGQWGSMRCCFVVHKGRHHEIGLPPGAASGVGKQTQRSRASKANAVI